MHRFLRFFVCLLLPALAGVAAEVQVPVAVELRPAAAPSASADAKHPAQKQIRLHAGSSTWRIVLDLDVLRRLLLATDDLGRVDLVLTAAEPAASATLRADASLVVRPDGATRLVGDLAPELRRLLASPATRVELPVTLIASAPLGLSGVDASRESRPRLLVTTKTHPKALLWEHAVKIQPGVYTVSRDGHLFYGEQRLRLWGSLGYGDIPRMRRMGFNAWRVWPVANTAYSAASIRTGDFAPAVKGDKSPLDQIDRMYSEFKDNGFFLMATQLMGVMPPALVTRDDSFVAGGADWAEWKAAVKAIPAGADAAGPALYRRMAFVDERLLAVRKRHISNFLNRVNPYTGRRYAEEEHIAIWELDNELSFAKHVLDGGAAKWPAYFKAKLDARWTAWARKRYPTDTALHAAWGALATGETPAALRAGPAASEARDFSRTRADDFVRFVLELTDEGYQTLRAHARSHAAPGVGVAIAPFSFDTQYKPSIPWLYQQTRSDVANFGMYFWDNKSLLTQSPGAYLLDSLTVEGKPTVLYETNQSRPGPYRAEFPYRLAALAAWQDWDAIFFHYWGGQGRALDEEFLVWPMKYMTVDHYWNSVHHDQDPAMTSAMALAGRIFVSGAIAPAPSPAIYRIGAKGIFSHKFDNGLGLRRDTFERGSRIRFEPEGDFELIKENAVGDTPPAYPVKSGDSITWDWREGRLVIDTPTAKAYVGPAPAAPFAFRDGITLSGVSSKWISFGLVSADGRPLADGASRAHASAVFDAVNTGFTFDWNAQGGPTDLARAISDHGRAPVRVDRVDYTVGFPATLDWRATSHDFALRRLDQATGRSNAFRVRAVPGAHADALPNSRPQEIWMSTLEIAARHAAAPAPADPSPGALAGGGSSARPAAVPLSPATPAGLGDLWHPLPGLSWSDDRATALRKLGAAAANSGSDAGITLDDTKLLFDSPAAIEIAFREARTESVVATFTRPPVLRDIVAAYEKRFGTPALKQLTDDQFEQSTVRWVVAGKSADLTILLTEAQGIVKLVFSVRPRG